MTLRERLTAITNLDKRLTKAVTLNRRLSLTPEEVRLLAGEGLSQLVSQLKQDALQDHIKCQNEQRRSPTNGENSGSISIVRQMASREGRATTSFDTTLSEDALSALRRAQRTSMPRGRR